MQEPHDRIKEFIENWPADRIDTTLAVGPWEMRWTHALTLEDLRDQTAELEDAYDVLAQIDKALDPKWAGVLVTEAEALEEIRRIMGRPKQ